MLVEHHITVVCVSVSLSLSVWLVPSESVLAAPARTGENPADTVLGVL